MAKPVEKQPWLKFYPSDWRAEPSLRICSIGARGLWMEMLCLMHDADPRGSLVVNGRPVLPRQLAVLVGAPLKEIEGYIEELEAAGVFSRDVDGTVFSRRMRRDIDKALRDRENGKGGGNPKLRGEDKGPDNPDGGKKDNGGVNPHPSPGDKAHTPATQRPEARKKEIDSATAVPEPPDPERDLERRCRQAVGEEPCLTEPNFGPILKLLDEPGITEADIFAGIAVGLAKSAADYRFRHWRNFDGWIRGAAKDRLAGKPRPAGAGQTAAAAGPIVMIRGHEVPEQNLIDGIDRWERTGDWIQQWGHPPDDLRCVIPRRYVPERFRQPEVAA